MRVIRETEGAFRQRWYFTWLGATGRPFDLWEYRRWMAGRAV